MASRLSPDTFGCDRCGLGIGHNRPRASCWPSCSLGYVWPGALVVTAATAALASSIMNAYTDERILRNHEDQKCLDSATGRAFASASTSTMLWNPQDLEVVLFVKAPNVFHRDRQPLRLVQTVCTGSPRPHARIIHGPLTDPIWRCYAEGVAVTSEVEMDVDHSSYPFHNLGIGPGGTGFKLSRAPARSLTSWMPGKRRSVPRGHSAEQPRNRPGRAAGLTPTRSAGVVGRLRQLRAVPGFVA